MALRFLPTQSDAGTYRIFQDLVREALTILVPFTILVTWCWTIVILYFTDAPAGFGYLTLALTVGSTAASYSLQQKHLREAVAVYLIGLALGITFIALAFHTLAVLYLYILVVLVASTLTNPRVTWGVTFASIVLVTAIGLNMGIARWTDVAFPITLILLTALTSWLSAQRLLVALSWTLNMTQQAQQNAEEARQHRAELARVLKSLDDAYVRLERANEALIYAQEAAARAYRFKAEFVANVSHELRTPLNLITGFSEMMVTAPESYKGTPLPSEYRGDIMAIYRSARHLSNLIDDVLDLSRIEAGSMPLTREPTDLREVASEAADMVKGLAQARGLHVEVSVADDVPILDLDRTRIRQVLLNLLSNATRFTDKGWIRVRVQREDREAVITVADSGRGINPERLARAFEAFSQLEDGQARQGSGLGLAVSRRFVELHGGRMWIESQPGQGTTVYFTLPIGQPYGQIRPLRAPIGTRLPAHSGRPVVVVLHDDTRILSLLKRHIQGYDFVCAETAADAQKAVEATAAAALIVDAAWAERSPQQMEKLHVPQHTSIIHCSLPSARRLGYLLGAVDFVPKPVTRQDLAAALARLHPPAKTILIVDDDPHVVRLLKRMLRAEDRSLTTLEAFGGKEALEIVRTKTPDVMLLDLVMPDVDGYAVLQAMANDATTMKTKVIIISAPRPEQESAVLSGPITVARGAGFSLTETLGFLQAALPQAASSARIAVASVAEPVETRPG